MHYNNDDVLILLHMVNAEPHTQTNQQKKAPKNQTKTQSTVIILEDYTTGGNIFKHVCFILTE